MPKFTQVKIEKKGGRAKGLPAEVIEEYAGYVKQLEKGNEGLLTFEEGESLAQARKALIEASVQTRKYVKVRKPRGVPNVLKFQLITKAQFDQRQKSNKARGGKIRAARAGKA